ncbi:MAG: hypothetical protein Q7U59_00170 [Lutibacter sp.]|nr:hypothetical protein [Lutibacter sp.]
MGTTDISGIFNYDFDWSASTKKKTHIEINDKCCEKFKNKSNKTCKKCPNRVAE